MNSDENKFYLFSKEELSNVSKDELKIFVEASEDFQAVLAGKKPIYAKFDDTVPLLSDGGTSPYIGNGYTLTVLKSLSSFGSLRGYVYGPIIYFDNNFATGNSNTINCTRFYSTQALKKLLKQ